MKYLKFTLVFVTFILFSNTALSADNPAIEINLPPAFEKNICKTKIWDKVYISWNGVKDLRSSKSVAAISKKNDQPTEFFTVKPVSDYFDQLVPTVLKECGINIVSKNQKHTYDVSLSINNFGVEMDKALVKSSINAESRITLDFESEYSSFEINVNYLSDSKGSSFKSAKKLESLISELMLGTLTEMIESKQMDFLQNL